MLDLKRIREQPEAVRQGLERKGADPALVGELLELDRQRREALGEVEALRAQRNAVSKEISQLKKAGEDAEDRIIAMREVNERIRELETELGETETVLEQKLLEIPNVPAENVPVGASEDENQEVTRWGELRDFDFEPRPHWEIGEHLGILDSAAGGKVTGTRFVVLRGAGAALERALIAFMIDVHTRRGYTEIAPPYLVNSTSLTGTGQLPKFAEDAFHCEQDDLWLIPTAEVPVTNLHRDEIVNGDQLPLHYVAYSACFRREAGAAGKDTRGLIRLHQFNKVELVKFVRPETSYEALESLLADAVHILQLLGLHYRVVEMCTGDLGFTASKKYDPEVWMPGQGRYVEISSCSNFEDFQARRANIRFRPEKGAKPQFVHTLNGSGLAVGRTLAAVLENYQCADGSVTIPEPLRPYMGDTQRLSPSE